MKPVSLVRFAWLSIAAALVTIGLKFGAYLMTNSVGLLSDALESVVNLVAAVIALAVVYIASKPPDAEHAYGHSKVEYFSSGIEGSLIFAAAIGIGITSVNRLLHPQPVEQIGVGLLISFIASSVNFIVSRILAQAGRVYRSITLEADAYHLMVDVWTSIAVAIGVGAVALTGAEWLDSVIALIVAANIIRTGFDLVRRSMLGLIDTALPATDIEQIQRILDKYTARGIQTHALRSRQSGARRFVSFHVLAPSNWTISDGHKILEQIESDVRRALPGTTVFTHLEPADEAVSYQDVALDRAEDREFRK